MRLNEGVIPKHGGHQGLKAFRTAEMNYDATLNGHSLFLNVLTR